MARTHDLLDELMDERSATNPAFPGMVAAAYERRRLLHMLAARLRSIVRARNSRDTECALRQLQSWAYSVRDRAL
jgi:hypothetical protein